MSFSHGRVRSVWLGVCLFLVALPGWATSGPNITLSVDATEAPRKIFHARLRIPASPGTLTLFYPKWLTGEHAPDGPINDLAGLKFSAGGQTLKWRRDLLDGWTINVEVPAGQNEVTADLDFLSPATFASGFSGGSSATDKLVIISWTQVLLSPQGWKAEDITFSASLKLPRGWKYGTALPGAREVDNDLHFAPAPLTTLIDSPLLAGEFLKAVPMPSLTNPPAEIDVA